MEPRHGAPGDRPRPPYGTDAQGGCSTPRVHGGRGIRRILDAAAPLGRGEHPTASRGQGQGVFRSARRPPRHGPSSQVFQDQYPSAQAYFRSVIHMTATQNRTRSLNIGKSVSVRRASEKKRINALVAQIALAAMYNKLPAHLKSPSKK